MTISRDSYDPAKQYDRVLIQSDSRIPDFDINELQQLADEKHERLGSNIFKEGGRVKGGDLAIVGNDAKLDAAIVFAKSQLRAVPPATLALTKTGVERIGVLVTFSTITAVEDPSLVSPRTGQPTGQRRKVTNTWVKDNPNAVTVWTLVDGEVLTVEPPPAFSSVEVAMSRRTFDSSGDFVSLWNGVVIEDLDANNCRVFVRPMAGYVLGRLLEKPSGARMTVPLAKSTRVVEDEPKVFATGTSLYNLNNSPVAVVNNITSTVQVSRTVTRGNIPNTFDLLPDTPVASIVSITQGMTTFTPTTDYVLTGDSVDWSPAGGEPSAGSTYTVVFRYIKQMTRGVRTLTAGTQAVTRGGSANGSDTFNAASEVQAVTSVTNGATTYVLGTDYTVSIAGVGVTIDWAPGGAEPGTGVSYTVAFDRWVHTVEGDYLAYNSYDVRSKAPIRNQVDFSPTGDNPVDTTAFYVDYEHYLPRRDLVWMGADGTIGREEGKPHPTSPQVPATPAKVLALGWLNLLADSTAVTFNAYEIEGVTMAGIQAMKRELAELRYNQAKLDLERDARTKGVGLTLRGIFTDTFRSLVKGDTGHPLWNVEMDQGNGVMLLPQTSIGVNLSVVAGANYTEFERLLFPSFTDEVILAQDKGTEDMLVNPFNVFTAPVPLIRMTPDNDTWIESDSSWVSRLWSVPINGMVVSDQVVSGDMRQRQVAVQGFSHGSLEDNIALYFNGSKVSLTPTAPTVAGTQAGTVKADTWGAWKATFTVPAGIPSGRVDVYTKGSFNRESERAPYEGSTTIRRVSITNIFVQRTDPLAQSFVIEQDRWMSAIGLYFTAKDASAPCRIELRNMVNGYPGTEVYAWTVLKPSDITVSANGTTETKVEWADPVFLRANFDYCIVVRAEVNTYRLRVATLGQTDPVNGYVGAQPYSIGVLFQSSNNTTWSAVQTSDLKFRIYGAKWTASQATTVTFADLTGGSFGALLVAAQQLVPNGCSVKWEYMEDLLSGVWLPTEAWAETTLTTVRTTSRLRLTMTASADGTLAPCLELSASQLRGLLYDSAGKYIGRGFALAQSPDEAHVYMESAVPSGTTLACYVTLDDGANWHLATLVSTTQVDDSFSQYYWTFDFDGASVTGTQPRVRFDLATSNQLISPRGRNLMTNMA